MQAVGQGEELGGGFSEGGLRFGDLLAAVDDGRQLGRTAVAQVDQPGFVRDVVFLLERDQRVEAGRAFRQPLRIGVEPFCGRSGRIVDVFQLFGSGRGYG